MRLHIIPLLLFFISTHIYAQNLVQSGPMLGYSDHREVALWIQTKSEATVQFRFWEVDKPLEKKKTEAILTKKERAFAATLLASDLLPGKKYGYEVLVNGKVQTFSHLLQFQTLPLWQYRTDPPDITFAAGSCAYVNEPFWDRPGKPYGDSMVIFQTIHQQKPDFMVWVGDNTYTREGDWNTWGGYMHRYTHTRSLPEMQALLASTHNYAIWDDHDFGPNNADRSFWNKETASRAFDIFWANAPGKPLGPGPCINTFTWSDCQFFMLDDEWFRAPNNSADSTRDYFGEAQLNWLTDALLASRARFKFVVSGGQILNPARVYENYAIYPVERRKFLDHITKAGVPGVFIITGDRHHTELTRLERPGTYTLYDLTTSPLTSGTHKPGNEANTSRVEGTLYNGRNFALIKVSGAPKERKLTIRILNSVGKLVWEKDILASELN